MAKFCITRELHGRSPWSAEFGMRITDPDTSPADKAAMFENLSGLYLNNPRAFFGILGDAAMKPGEIEL